MNISIDMLFLASSPLNIVAALEMELLFAQLCKTLRPRWQFLTLLQTVVTFRGELLKF